MRVIAPLKSVDNIANTYPDYITKDSIAVSSIFDNIKNGIEKGSWRSVAFYL